MRYTVHYNILIILSYSTETPEDYMTVRFTLTPPSFTVGYTL